MDQSKENEAKSNVVDVGVVIVSPDKPVVTSSKFSSFFFKGNRQVIMENFKRRLEFAGETKSKPLDPNGHKEKLSKLLESNEHKTKLSHELGAKVKSCEFIDGNGPVNWNFSTSKSKANIIEIDPEIERAEDKDKLDCVIIEKKSIESSNMTRQEWLKRKIEKEELDPLLMETIRKVAKNPILIEKKSLESCAQKALGYNDFDGFEASMERLKRKILFKVIFKLEERVLIDKVTNPFYYEMDDTETFGHLRNELGRLLKVSPFSLVLVMGGGPVFNSTKPATLNLYGIQKNKKVGKMKKLELAAEVFVYEKGRYEEIQKQRIDVISTDLDQLNSNIESTRSIGPGNQECLVEKTIRLGIKSKLSPSNTIIIELPVQTAKISDIWITFSSLYPAETLSVSISQVRLIFDGGSLNHSAFIDETLEDDDLIEVRF